MKYKEFVDVIKSNDDNIAHLLKIIENDSKIMSLFVSYFKDENLTYDQLADRVNALIELRTTIIKILEDQVIGE